MKLPVTQWSSHWSFEDGKEAELTCQLGAPFIHRQHECSVSRIPDSEGSIISLDKERLEQACEQIAYEECVEQKGGVECERWDEQDRVQCLHLLEAKLKSPLGGTSRIPKGARHTSAETIISQILHSPTPVFPEVVELSRSLFLFLKCWCVSFEILWDFIWIYEWANLHQKHLSTVKRSGGDLFHFQLPPKVYSVKINLYITENLLYCNPT